MQGDQLNKIIMLFKECGFRKVRLLAQVVFIIITIGHIGLYKIATNLNTKAKKLDSKEKAVRRLLDTPISAEVYARFIESLFNLRTESYEFAMDRTNWKLGSISVNLLILSFNWNNIAIPIYAIFLDNKGGSSGNDERQMLISWFIKRYGADKILNLFADREFPSIEFIRYLLAEKVNFIFRIKDNILATDTVKGKLSRKKLSRLFRELYNGNYKAELHIRRLLDNRVFVAAKRNLLGELIVLISNRFHDDPFALYAHRWHIECMFNKMKTKGLNLESTHITKSNRIIALFAIVSIVYCYCSYIGELRHSIVPIKEKLINGIKQKSQAVFRYGFDLLQQIIVQAAYSCKQLFQQLFDVLTGNPLKKGSKLQCIILSF